LRSLSNMTKKKRQRRTLTDTSGKEFTLYRVTTGFICNDLMMSSNKGKAYKLYEYTIKKRRLGSALNIDLLGVAWDKKTKQKWGKFAVSKSDKDFHIWGHHLMRQLINHVIDLDSVGNDSHFFDFTDYFLRTKHFDKWCTLELCMIKTLECDIGTKGQMIPERRIA
jgi:hypothetical protein